VNSAKPRRGLTFTLLNVSLFNRVNPVKFAKQLFNRVNSHHEVGGMCEGCGGRRSRHCLVAVVKKINTMIVEFNNGK